MIRTYKRCPYCWKLYDITSPSAKPQGASLRECTKCHGTFIDKDYREPFFCDPPQVITLWQLILGFLWPLGVSAIFFWYLAFQEADLFLYILAALLSGIYLFLVIYGYIKRWDSYEKLCEEHRRSKERLMNRDYVILLLNNDCYVPTYFLAHYYPDLVNYKVKSGPSTQNISNTFIT